jgi:hypothetical protein
MTSRRSPSRRLLIRQAINTRCGMPPTRSAKGELRMLAKSGSTVAYAGWAQMAPRRRGREAEGGGLLNRYRVSSPIEGSNPSVSASDSS